MLRIAALVFLGSFAATAGTITFVNTQYSGFPGTFTSAGPIPIDLSTVGSSVTAVIGTVKTPEPSIAVQVPVIFAYTLDPDTDHFPFHQFVVGYILDLDELGGLVLRGGGGDVTGYKNPIRLSLVGLPTLNIAGGKVAFDIRAKLDYTGVPEPATLLLISAPLLALGFRRCGGTR